MNGVLIQLILGVLCVIALCILQWRVAWWHIRVARLRLIIWWQGAAAAFPTAQAAQLDAVPGTAALLHTPDFATLRQELHTLSDGAAYVFPVGWVRGARPGLVYAALIGDVNHTLITGKSDSGKDNAALGILFALATRHTAQQVQICVIDQYLRQN